MTGLEMLVRVGQGAEHCQTACMVVMGAFLAWCTGVILVQGYRRLRHGGRR